MNGAKKKHGVWFDPRVKLLLLLLCVLSTMFSPSLAYGLGLAVLIALFGVLCGRARYSLIAVLAYALIYALTVFALGLVAGTLRTMFVAFLGLVHKVYPCGMMAGIMISTTTVSECLSAMNRVHAPKKLAVPLAVMLRYLPVIREDWGFIKDAMKMRDVPPSLKGLATRPGTTIECVYVPMMMAASKTADELSIASVTRGIENPKPRTCLIRIRFGTTGLLAVFCFLAYFVFGLMTR
jgi:energy-coupling factor transport system permease protein